MSDVTRAYLRLRKRNPDCIALDICRRDGEPGVSVEVSLEQLHHAVQFIESTFVEQYAFACLPPLPEGGHG